MNDLVTARLVLHPLSAEEAELLLAGECRGDDWAPDYPEPGDLVAARHYLGRRAELGETQPYGPYVIRLREGGTVLGGVGFHGPADADGQVTIGYGLVPSARGRGYASEALRALLDFARASGVRRVIGDADQENVASHRVMGAAGMALEREDEKLKHFGVDFPVPTA
ncbi:GNAT family N-acetyltransferase [Streptomyces sp. NPDC001941]|uniref:GNAT family N-acetyltransferase n=1 Tax=Streptomyces sp. NPDC001941 TaxID=3154659 RepID=UPI00332CD9A7